MHLMRAVLASLFAIGISATGLFGTVSIGFSADRLKDANSNPLPVGAPVYLIVDTAGDGYDGPAESGNYSEASAFATDDDRLIASFTIVQPGTADGMAGGITAPDGVSAGQPVYAVWVSANSEGADYGVFTAPAGYNPPSDSAPWVYPSEGSTVDLFLITADSSFAGSISGTIMSADTGIASEVAGTLPPPPMPFGSVLQVDGPWVEYAQMGWIESSTAPWHQGYYFGYFYYFGSGEGPFWAWTYSLGWFWANPEIWPTFYAYDLGWVRYQKGTPAPERWFYEYTSGEWLREADL